MSRARKAAAPLHPAIVELIRVLARDAALADYRRQTEQAGDQHDGQSGDLRPVQFGQTV